MRHLRPMVALYLTVIIPAARARATAGPITSDAGMDGPDAAYSLQHAPGIQAGLGAALADSQPDVSLDTCINVLDVGAWGDGVGDDTVAFQEAVARAEPGQTLLLPAGCAFRLNRNVVITRDIVIWGYGATILEDGGSLVGEGRLGDGADADANIPCDQTYVCVQPGDETQLSPGDEVIVYHADVTAGGIFSEIHRVADVASGRIELDGYIIHRYDLQWSPRIARWDPISIRLYGVKFESTAGNNSHLRLTDARNCLLQDLDFTGLDRAAQTETSILQRVHGLTCRGWRIYDCHWAVARLNSCGNVVIDDCHATRVSYPAFFTRWSHAISVSNCTNTYTVGGYHFCVEGCRDVAFANCHWLGTPDSASERSAGYTNHSGHMCIGTTGAQYTNCSWIHCYGEAPFYWKTSNYRFSDGDLCYPGDNVSLNDCYFYNRNDPSPHGQIYLRNTGRNIRITDCTFDGDNAYPIHSRAAVDNLIIGNCQFYHDQGRAIYLHTPDKAYRRGVGSVTIHDCQVVCDVNMADVEATRYNRAIAVVNVDPNGFVHIHDNQIRWTGQGHRWGPSMIEVCFARDGNPLDTDCCNRKLLIHDNQAYSDGPAVRFLDLESISGTPWTPGNIRVWDNQADVRGVAYQGQTWPVMEVITAFADGDTTPSTFGLSKMFKTGSSQPTTVINLDDGRQGQMITIFGADGGNTTIKHHPQTLILAGGMDCTLADAAAIQLIHDGTRWCEFIRSHTAP